MTKRKSKKTKVCAGCSNSFLLEPLKKGSAKLKTSSFLNYDYCSNCALNNSRYVQQKCPERSPGYFDKCPECGDGSGWIKFPGQPPRKCKVCALNNMDNKSQEKYWDQVNQLAQEKIYHLLTSNIPFQNIKLIKEDYTFEERQQKLSGLFLTRDSDYRTLLSDIENQYADTNLPEAEQLAEEIAVNYFYLVFKALLTDLSDYYGFDPSYFSSENLIN